MSWKWKKTFVSNGLKVNILEAKIMFRAGNTKDELSKSKIYPWGICGLRAKANSVLCAHVIRRFFVGNQYSKGWQKIFYTSCLWKMKSKDLRATWAKRIVMWWSGNSMRANISRWHGEHHWRVWGCRVCQKRMSVGFGVMWQATVWIEVSSKAQRDVCKNYIQPSAQYGRGGWW